jgi:hypothetical protein
MTTNPLAVIGSAYRYTPDRAVEPPLATAPRDFS